MPAIYAMLGKNKLVTLGAHQANVTVLFKQN